jgi:hypothetical protein
MQNELNQETREPRTGKFLIALPFVLAAVIAGYLWAETQRRPSRPSEITWSIERSEGARVERELVLLYPTADADWHTETRVVRGFESERQEIQFGLEAFLAGPSEMGAILPGRGRLSLDGAYLDGRGGLIIDLKTDTFPLNIGGVNAEYQLIQSFMNMIRSNFPAVSSVTFLLNGQSEETLAGHIDIRRPFSTGV